MTEQGDSLPQGLIRYEGGLRERIIKMDKYGLDLYDDYLVMLGPDTVGEEWFFDLGDFEVSSKKSDFFGDISPVYDGYMWYRGYLIKKGGNGVVILRPWISRENKETEVLLVGEPAPEWVDQVVGRYLDKTEEIQKDLRETNKEIWKRRKAGLN